MDFQEQLRYYCEHGNISQIKQLIQEHPDEIDINNHDDLLFYISCANNYLELAKWLVEYGKEKGTPIDIYAIDESTFRACCTYGHFEILKWLIKLGKDEIPPINIHFRDEILFRLCVIHHHSEIAKWLIRLGTNFPSNYNRDNQYYIYQQNHIKYYENITNKKLNKHKLNMVWNHCSSVDVR